MTNAINLHGNNLYFHENHPVISKVLCFIPFLGDRVGRYCLDEIDTRIQELGGRHLFQRADGIENLVDCLKVKNLYLNIQLASKVMSVTILTAGLAAGIFNSLAVIAWVGYACLSYMDFASLVDNSVKLALMEPLLQVDRALRDGPLRNVLSRVFP